MSYKIKTSLESTLSFLTTMGVVVILSCNTAFANSFKFIGSCEKALSKDVERAVQGKIQDWFNKAVQTPEIETLMNSELGLAIVDEIKRTLMERFGDTFKKWTITYREELSSHFEAVRRTGVFWNEFSKGKPRIDSGLIKSGKLIDPTTNLPRLAIVMLDVEWSVKLLSEYKKNAPVVEEPAVFAENFGLYVLKAHHDLRTQKAKQGTFFDEPIFHVDRKLTATLKAKFGEADPLLVEKAVYEYLVEGTSFKDLGPSSGQIPRGLSLIEGNKELARKIFYAKSLNNKKVGVQEVEQSIAQALIDGLKVGNVEISKGDIKQNVFNKTRAVFAVINEEFRRELIRTKGAGPLDWEKVKKSATDLSKELIEELKVKVPISSKKAEDIQNELVNLDYFPLAKKGGDGRLRISISGLKLDTTFDPKLGTILLTKQDDPSCKKVGPVLICDHGAGTIKSNGPSFKYLIPRLATDEINPIAMDFPGMGSAVKLDTPEEQLVWMDQRNTEIFSRLEDWYKNIDPAVIPVLGLGRSMGATRLLATKLFNPRTRLDGITLMSYSNPETFEIQIANVYKQVENGTLDGVLEEDLERARSFVQPMLSVLEEDLGSAEAQKLMQSFGDDILVLQGNADEDGGDEVGKVNTKYFRSRFPRIHYYPFGTTLRRYYDLEALKEVDPELFEATHFIMTGRSNMSVEHAANIIPKVPIKDIPKVADQTFEAILVSVWAFMDYRIEAPALTPEIAEVKARFTEYRKQFLSVSGSKASTFSEWYRLRYKISNEDYAKAKAGRSSLAARAKRVDRFWAYRLKQVRGLDVDSQEKK